MLPKLAEGSQLLQPLQVMGYIPTVIWVKSLSPIASALDLDLAPSSIQMKMLHMVRSSHACISARV